MSINERYEQLTDPVEFVKNFKTEAEFVSWLRRAKRINDLRACRTAFQESELYEHCRLIQHEIDDRIDNILKGIGFDVH